jgi:hypothetical protein
VDLRAGETVTILRPGPPTQDEYGNDVPGPPTEIPVPGCGVAPQQSSELTQARDTVTAGLTLYAPWGTDLRPTDKVRVRGIVYDVTGEPGGFRSPFTGSTGPVVATLERVTG